MKKTLKFLMGALFIVSIFIVCKLRDNMQSTKLDKQSSAILKTFIIDGSKHTIHAKITFLNKTSKTLIVYGEDVPYMNEKHELRVHYYNTLLFTGVDIITIYK